MAHITIEMSGTTPILCHNIQLSDPFNPFVRQIAELTKKRRKTDEDHHAIARLEWFGGVYSDPIIPGLVVPCANIRKCLIQTAKVTKEGKAVERALSFAALSVPLQHDGPGTLDEMYELDAYKFRCAVRVSGKVVMRMRPRFPVWKVQADAYLLEDLLDLDDAVRIVERAGIIEGLGDGRTIGYGRFEGKVVAHD